MAKKGVPMSQKTMQMIRDVPLRYKAQSSNMQIPREGLSVLKAVDESGTVDLAAPSSSDLLN